LLLGRLVVALGVGSAVVAALRGGRPSPPAPQPASSVPPFPIGGPCTTAWREEALTKVQELSGLASWIGANPRKATLTGSIPQTIVSQLETVRRTAAKQDTRNGKRVRPWTRLMASVSGAAIERTLGNLDAVEADLLRLAPEDYLRGQLPSLQAHVNRYLNKDDPRRVRIADLATQTDRALTDADRDTLVGAHHAANSQRRRELTRLRSFRNLLFGGILTLFGLAILLAILSARHPEWLPLCFLPEDKMKFVCPLQEVHVAHPAVADIDDLVGEAAKPRDVLVIEMVGRSSPGSSTPRGRASCTMWRARAQPAKSH
jgi:hypothetical protein